jgi:hypothetical protein
MDIGAWLQELGLERYELRNLCKSSRVQQSWYSVAQGDVRQRLGG